jgi:hypothetical protein
MFKDEGGLIVKQGSVRYSRVRYFFLFSFVYFCIIGRQTNE